MPKKLWLRLAAGAAGGLVVGLLLAHLPWPWPAVVLAIAVLAMVVWLIREQRELRRMKRQLEDWQARLEEIERQD